MLSLVFSSRSAALPSVMPRCWLARWTRLSNPLRSRNPGTPRRLVETHAPDFTLLRSHIDREQLLNQLETRHLGALVRHFEIALYRLAAEFEGMRLARLARGQHLDLGDRVVELRVVRH